ncbi:DUF6455 family protein [Rhodobacter capsulatus]|uniref:DUF6455 family protein n=1 Tax=Rhodobacter capsulatus TaxID=1061 RepID=UPI004025871D
MMGIQGNIDLYFWIARGMGRRMGVNLTEAMHEGLLSQSDFAQMINHCRMCAGSEGCLAYLSEHSEDRGSAPDWCANGPVLREIGEMV